MQRRLTVMRFSMTSRGRPGGAQAQLIERHADLAQQLLPARLRDAR
jgi:hypothetical protein